MGWRSVGMVVTLVGIWFIFLLALVGCSRVSRLVSGYLCVLAGGGGQGDDET